MPLTWDRRFTEIDYIEDSSYLTVIFHIKKSNEVDKESYRKPKAIFKVTVPNTSYPVPVILRWYFKCSILLAQKEMPLLLEILV